MDNVKLGLFVMAGIIFLVTSLYLIGSNRNLFGSTITINASFQNVNGLMPGNNVRFAGIDVGTVREITIKSDTTILVTMVIDKSIRPYIKKNSIASVGTDGLMGNKLININSQSILSKPVEENDTIYSRVPIETDEMLRTLNFTNDNLAVITSDLRRITLKINNSNSLWKLLSDTLIARDLKEAASHIKEAGKNAADAGNSITDLIHDVKQGNGLAGALIADTVMINQLRQSMAEIQHVSTQTSAAAADFYKLIERVKQGDGMAGALVADTMLAKKLNQSLENIEQGTNRFNENMMAMREHFLFREYFKKQEKKQKKGK